MYAGGGLDQRADSLIRKALEFIEDIRAEARLIDPAAVDLSAPPPDVVLLQRRWPPRDTFDRARQALTGAHFRARIEALRAQE